VKNGTKLLLLFLIPLVSLLAWILGNGAYLMHLNYSGYCLWEGRYLTNEEKIRMVVEPLVSRGPPLPFWPMRDRAGEVVRDSAGKALTVLEGSDEPVEPDYYRNIDEFFAANPHCCEVRSYYSDSEGIWEPDFWDRVAGDAGGVVWATYRFSYRDSNGVEHSSTYTYKEPLNNCGIGIQPG